jgi:hypothetical protein
VAKITNRLSEPIVYAGPRGTCSEFTSNCSRSNPCYAWEGNQSIVSCRERAA